MEEPCPICGRNFPIRFIERHVNSCLDTLEPPKLASPEHQAEEKKQPEEKKQHDAFAALGLKAHGRAAEKQKKASATLTSLLLAEKRLKRKQEELENAIRLKENAEQSTEVARESTQTITDNRPPQESRQGQPDAPALSSSQQEAIGQSQDSQIQESQESEPGLVTPKVSAAEQRLREIADLRRSADLPLAQRLRPKTLAEFYGQEKLVGPDGLLRNFLKAKSLPSFILWGVPGVGKTSLARIVSQSSNYKFVELSGSESNAKRLKEAFANAQNEKNLTGQKTILFLDEIHRFNKAVQDLLLPVIEKGIVTVVGATTENPSFTLNNALLSRMHTFVMEPLSQEALVKVLNRGLFVLNKTRKLLYGLHLMAMSKDAIDHIAALSTGDSRVALNILESVNAYFSGEQFEAEKSDLDLQPKLGAIKITLDKLKPLLKSRNFHQMYDKNGDNHYDTISAFHKSVRGSNADAAIFYLVKMLSGGEDPLFIARRMIVIASEDVGLRDSSCLPFAIAALEALQFVGMPEGEIILAHCAVKLARAPKLTKSYRALRKAQALMLEKPEVVKLPVPLHLRNAPTSLMKDLGYGESYKYNPNFKHGIIRQDFLPPEVQNERFVEDTHLGTLVDDAVDEKDYASRDAEEQDYRKFKKRRISEIKNQMADFRRKSRLKNGQLRDAALERLSSYDENLSKDDQPEYFDGTERDNYSDDSDCVDNFNCSYDEFQT